MIVILLLIPLSIIIAIGFLAAFIWAVRSGQYEDTCTPSMRLLLEEEKFHAAKKSQRVFENCNNHKSSSSSNSLETIEDEDENDDEDELSCQGFPTRSHFKSKIK